MKPAAVRLRTQAIRIRSLMTSSGALLDGRPRQILPFTAVLWLSCSTLRSTQWHVRALTDLWSRVTILPRGSEGIYVCCQVGFSYVRGHRVGDGSGWVVCLG